LGFLVVVPNYRLCPHISVFDGPVTDSKDCLVWAVKELPALLKKEKKEKKDGGDDYYEIDTSKVVTMGHSGGGGLALRMVSMNII
jgi:acetyl esterase/lipase